MFRFSIFAFLLFKTISILAQNPYPQGYFIMPIDPGQTSSLSGCFGDIRINHFHAGLDLRTGGAEGKNVYAAAEGYVSRIKVQNGGYGNAIYITHPNGYTTVYAHLKELNETLQKFLIKNQYEKETWEIDFKLDPNMFTVKKGDIIALSGNTGGSGGPHLHFEIRDKEENALDPSLFGFKELIDRAKPEIIQISLKCLSEDARINGSFGLFNFNVIKLKNGLYSLPQKIYAKGKIGLEILTFDRSGNSLFRQGVSQILLKVNQEEVFNFRIDTLAFHNKLDMNVHVNYEKLISKGQKIHKCYIDNGNTLNLYKSNKERGVFEIINQINPVEILVSDAFANTVNLKFNILHDELLSKESNAKYVEKITTSIIGNYLEIDVADPMDIYSNIEIMESDTKTISQLNIEKTGKKSKIIDLKKTNPSQILIANREIPLPFNFRVKQSDGKLSIPGLAGNFEKTMFDDLYLNINKYENALEIHSDIIPLKGYASLDWAFAKAPDYPEKYKIYLIDKKPKFIGGNWNGTVVSFKIKELGTYQALYDFEPPIIIPKLINNKSIRLKIEDKLSGIKKIEAFLNHNWLLMQFEYKNGMIWAEKNDSTEQFEGNLVVKITDNCDNIQTFETIIINKNETSN
jgi:murein DD-endopeptidase MepM/ murein hydrolase activator NlpD